MTRGGRLAAFLVLLPVACGGPTVTPRPQTGPAKAAPGEEGERFAARSDEPADDLASRTGSYDPSQPSAWPPED